MLKTYRGWLYPASNGEEDDLVGLRSEDGEEELIAETVMEDIDLHGRFLTVRYFTADAALAVDTLGEIFARQLYGKGEADYAVRYSEITGYLWTDETLRVGGHSLLAELRSNFGKFLHLEIEYHPQPRVTP